MKKDNLIIIRNSAVLAGAGAVGCSLGSGASFIISFILFFPIVIVAFLLGFPWIKNSKLLKSDDKNDRLYDQVANELKEEIKIPGLYTKAFSESSGDKSKAQALYIQYRVEQLRKEKQVQAEREHDREKLDRIYLSRAANDSKRAAAAAKPPLSKPVKAANVCFGILCGFISAIAALGVLCACVNSDTWKGDTSDIINCVLLLLFGLGVAYLFGWLASVSFKEAYR
jgi:biotin transporter BioY